MSEDRFRDIADKLARNPEEKRVIQEGLKAAREGRDADLYRAASQLTAKTSKNSGWLIAALVVGAIFLLYFLRS